MLAPKAMRGASTGIAAKRRLPSETSDGRVIKRARSPNKPEIPRLVAAVFGKEQASRQGDDVKAASARKNSEAARLQRSHGDNQTSSSSSDASDTSAETSSDDEDGASSTQVGATSSADNSNDDSSGDDKAIQNLPRAKKPPISALHPASDLRTRLSSFLPELQKANADLHDSSGPQARRLDEVADDEEHYIEMDLGLGVLKEKRSRTSQAHGLKLSEEHSTSSSEVSDSDPVEAEDAADDEESDLAPLADLMGGRQASVGKPSIQELMD